MKVNEEIQEWQINETPCRLIVKIKTQFALMIDCCLESKIGIDTAFLHQDLSGRRNIISNLVHNSFRLCIHHFNLKNKY
jgi:hypothetical protein